MNILIIGGLIALAFVAILGAVALMIGEERAEKEQQAKKTAALAEQAQPEPQTSLAPMVSRPSGQLTSYPSGQLTSHPSGQLYSKQTVQLTSRPTTLLSGHLSGQLTPTYEDAALNNGDLHSQVSEITNELNILTHKTGELERRLAELNALLERRRAVESHQFYAPDADITLHS